MVHQMMIESCQLWVGDALCLVIHQCLEVVHHQHKPASIELNHKMTKSLLDIASAVQEHGAGTVVASLEEGIGTLLQQLCCTQSSLSQTADSDRGESIRLVQPVSQAGRQRALAYPSRTCQQHSLDGSIAQSWQQPLLLASSTHEPCCLSLGYPLQRILHQTSCVHLVISPHGIVHKSLHRCAAVEHRQ